MSQLSQRESYRPSGRVDWSRLVWVLPVAIAWSGLLAAAFCLLVAWGYYVMTFTVLIPPACFAPWVASRIVRSAHCRSQVLAGVLSGLMGLGGYSAYLHADQCLRWGVPWTAVDRLPGYVVFRMETDRWHFVHQGALLRPAEPAPGVVPWRRLAAVNVLTRNWGQLLFDVCTLTIGPLAGGMVAARKPYSESRRRWCACEKLVLARKEGVALGEALITNQIDVWVQSGPHKAGEHEPHITVSVWYTPRDPLSDVDWDVFVAINRGARWRLSPAEAADMTVLFPALQDLAGPSVTRLAAEASQSPNGARIRLVPPQLAGLAQNSWTRALGRGIVVSAMIGPGLSVMIILAGGTWLLSQLAQGPQPLVPIWLVTAYVFGVAVASRAFIGWWHKPERQMSFELGRRFDHWLLRRAIRQRPSPLVAADDPEAIFVEMSPRRLLQLDGDCDYGDGDYNHGLLRFDWEQERLLFEGDYACYEIPAAAIQECRVEGFPGTGKNTGGLFAVVLQVQLGEGAWELPLFPLRGLEGATRWHQAWALFERIESLCGREFAEQPSEPPPAPPIAVC
ncbi:MAG: hypothetical protein L0211_08080 [Planctomycetaceae bacterium]|nr:hypothetical protein [Planctomycetaceae bacterium]